MKNDSELKPIILCCGENGRAVIFGFVDREPTPGDPVTIYRARMILRWDRRCGGLFGLAANGPKGDTRLTPTVEKTVETKWQEWITVTSHAAELLGVWCG